MSKHTPEPWIASCDCDDTDEANVISANGIVIARLEDAPEIRERHNKGRVEEASNPGPSPAAAPRFPGPFAPKKSANIFGFCACVVYTIAYTPLIS